MNSPTFRDMGIVRLSLYSLVVVVLAGTPTNAQPTVSDSVVAQSIRRDGRMAGRAAAEKMSVRDLVLPAFIGGASFGAGSLLLSGADRETTIAAAFLMGAGVAVIATTATTASRQPIIRPTAAPLQMSAEYLAAFDAAFAERLRQRRRNTIVLGSLGGGIAGGAAMYLLISQLLST